MVEDPERFARAAATWTGGRDLPEYAAFKTDVLAANGFHELEQEDYTHDSATGRSRSDTVYVNVWLSGQLDREWGGVAFPCVPHLSAHRPVSFYCRGGAMQTDRARDAYLGYAADVAEEASPPGRVRRLALLIDAMSRAAEAVHLQRRGPPATGSAL